MVSNITGNTQCENCILLDFYFHGLSVPRNQRKLEPHDSQYFKLLSVIFMILFAVHLILENYFKKYYGFPIVNFPFFK